MALRMQKAGWRRAPPQEGGSHESESSRSRLTYCLVLAGSRFAAGLMQPRDADLPPLQIEDHRVHVTIHNGFAATEVDPIFFNPNEVDLEAIYTFPLPRDASLSELSMWVDGQEPVGEVVEQERAKNIYEKERSAGRDTARADKRDYVAFDVFVGSVRANRLLLEGRGRRGAVRGVRNRSQEPRPWEARAHGTEPAPARSGPEHARRCGVA